MGSGCCAGEGSACAASKDMARSEQQNMEINPGDEDAIEVSIARSSQCNEPASSARPFQGVSCCPPVIESADGSDISRKEAADCVRNSTSTRSDGCGALPAQGGTPASAAATCASPVISSPSAKVSRCGEKKCCAEDVGADIRTETEPCCVDQDSAGDDGPLCADLGEADKGDACNSDTGSWICSFSTSTECCNGTSISSPSLPRSGC